MWTARRTAALAALALMTAFAGRVDAGETRHAPKAVVELFTSQGCSSCPAADALMRELARRPDLVALAYHVDYWDYIGWPDSFGAKAYSDRQRDYAQSWGSARIYTPQMVVNGTEGVVGSRRNEVDSALGKAALPLPVSLAVDNDMLEISIDPDAALAPAVIWLVTYIDRAEVAIERGENEGNTIGYVQIVTGRQPVGMWEPGAKTHLKLPLSEILNSPSNGLAVLVQEEHDGLPGEMLGAALLQP